MPLALAAVTSSCLCDGQGLDCVLHKEQVLNPGTCDTGPGLQSKGRATPNLRIEEYDIVGIAGVAGAAAAAVAVAAVAAAAAAVAVAIAVRVAVAVAVNGHRSIAQSDDHLQ